MLLHQVKLPHFKHSAESETVTLPLPDKVVISMAQHLGAPCTPTVKVGDKVKIGDVIGSSEAAMSAPVHSSISGTVTAITDVLHISGRNMQSVVIENDGLEEVSDSVCPPTVENRSLIVLFLFIIFLQAHSKITQDVQHITVIMSALSPKIHTDATSAGSSAIITLSIIF